MNGSDGHGIVEQLLFFMDGEQAQTEQDRENLKRIRKFLDEIPGGFFIYRADAEEKILYVNAAILKIFGCADFSDFVELTGGTFKGLVHPGDVAQVEKSIIEQIDSSKDALDYVEYRILRKDGEVRYVEDYGHYIHTEIGDVFYVFITDATEKITRRILERADLIHEKREKEQKIESLTEEYDKERKLIRQEHLQRLEVIEGLSVNYDSILYADLDADTVLAYRISDRLGEQFERTLQIKDFSSVVSGYVEKWVYPADREIAAEKLNPEYMRRALAENDTYSVNYRTGSEGDIKYLQLRVARAGGEDTHKAVLGCRRIDDEIMQELKQKRALEEALKAANLADVAKNSFLSNMSHDMRTPLNAIFGFTALAKKNAADGKAVTEYLEKIEEAGKTILELIEKVLDLTYTQSQSGSVNETECSLRKILGEVHRGVAERAEKKKIDFSIDASGLIHDRVIADADKLKRALEYLADNAVKYNVRNGKAKITAVEKLRQTDKLSTFVFTVSDTGIGISEGAIEYIFEPFERENNTTQSGRFGTGLGLTIAKQLVGAMGGNIAVKSRVGEGSEFTVTLGLRIIAGESEPEPIEQNPSEYAGKRILLVEDNEFNQEIETEILSDMGFEVDTAENGRTAVEKVESAPADYYALVVMDIQMPVMDGRTAAKKIRSLSDPKKAQLPIVALSANAFESDKSESLKAGMNEHLPKPIDVVALSETLKNIFRKNR